MWSPENARNIFSCYGSIADPIGELTDRSPDWARVHSAPVILIAVNDASIKHSQNTTAKATYTLCNKD